MAKAVEIVKRELPSLLCHKCRRWVETQEKHNMFASIDGVKQPVTLYTCAECRGDAKVVTESLGPRTGRDEMVDALRGPYKAVVRDTVKLNPSGKTARAQLECGHECCIIPDATKARCRKCRPTTKGDK